MQGILEEGRRGEVVMISPKLAEVARDATAGLRVKDIMRLTGLARSTWERMQRGEIVGVDKLLAFANGLKLNPQIVLDAANAEESHLTAFDVLKAALQMTDLPAGSRYRIIQTFREELAKEQGKAEHAA